MSDATFAARLLAWFDQHGRHDLPWQSPRTPYRVWLSEVMLQQTQVATVVPYFARFVAALPDLRALAAAPQDDVLALWAGLGYYSRARNLQRAAQICVERHGGELPDDIDALSALPGIGRSTAAAILAQAHGARHAILDGNVKRVLARRHAVEGDVTSTTLSKALWPRAEALLPAERFADYTQATMDLGATICTRAAPACLLCPVAEDCVARIEGRVAELPSPRARKVVRRKSIALLLLVDDDARVLVARRPPTGIWGGLYSVPEFADAEALASHVRMHHAARVSPLDAFTHAFTHFTLDAQPFVAKARPAFVHDADARFIDAGELDAVALPTPIRRLLERHWESQPCPAP